MEIKELYLKNFGKFSDCHFYIEDGIHIFYGENEFGKSTLYAFIKAMLFGMERGRGRAALNDEFSHYQPWENPNYYAGVMRFTSGGKCFKLERNFDRYARSTSLICENDGEELSVEDGDLEMLLGGLTKESFESTVAIGQLAVRPGKELAEELKNYAANYYETGSASVDLAGALERLRARRKAVEQEIKELLMKQEDKKAAVRQECNYIVKDIEKFQNELEENQGKLKDLQMQIERPEVPGDTETGEIKGKSYFSLGAFGIIAGAAGRVWSALTASKSLISGGGPISVLSWLFLIIGIILIALGVRSLMKDQKAKSEDKGELFHQLEWESRRIKEEWKEKQVRYQNLQEQLAELEIPGENQKKLQTRSRALLLAEEKMTEASKNMVRGFGEILNQKASHILEQITQKRYSTLLADAQLNMTLLEDGKRISADRVSCGTIEQVYFAIRMAAAEILYEESLPVIFDDAFVYYDEKRLESTLKWLREQQRQVIIFTCQKREQEIVKQF